VQRTAWWQKTKMPEQAQKSAFMGWAGVIDMLNVLKKRTEKLRLMLLPVWM
jgi:hypothetical protein